MAYHIGCYFEGRYYKILSPLVRIKYRRQFI
nr:MAG TPA: hypothetical protein [Caudoviricetes sp.]